MSNGREFDKPSIYAIRVRGVLNDKRSDWFDGFQIEIETDDSVLVGPVSDQSELHGLLAKIRDLGLPIISVERVNNESGEKVEVQEVDYE